MNRIVKKTIVIALAGIMQVGIGAATLEASPRYEDRHHLERRYDDEHDRREFGRQQRIRHEQERHEREMQRRHDENEWEWRDRQDREKAHHEEEMRALGALAILAVVLHNQ